ncbi:RNA polymerase sigma factor, sigma-70 family [Gemmatirosa kalamazoonensis]|uniref:RNA polymerase sigma factor, sigma-70 family n=1 Tax=Gemmatirosa kalamazoonensis TaxID=861299 RepID=W0RCB0_9BACT|nr:sigma-70 family RNA polymerase sigma factor [Gemmatirosa kalamazoonensis]AHG88709.1 RNA polymerase sigma factor, sigma-70 family [Gemmatirosa kalamazoonensis]
MLPPSPAAPIVLDLTTRARTGDPDALGELYARHARALLALARRLLGSTADAEDVVHDVFLGLPEALRRYEERGSLESWLKRVTARMALNRLRSRRRAREVTLTPPPSVHDATGALDTLDAIDALALQGAIDALPDALRAVLVLKEIEGYSHAEVAALLDITRGASEVRLHRAVAALRQALGAGTP